jgi:drug/metabolite transporter (DMT)-like permease
MTKTPEGPPGEHQLHAGDGRDETPMERVDRNLEELTGELRVVITGVQVLFAFLLIVPFNTGFAHVGKYERTVYFITLLLATLAAVCVIAPSAQHRFLFRHDDKEHLVVVANRIVIVGLAFLALAMSGCLLLVATKLFGVPAGILTVILGAIPFGTLWFALPLRRRRKLDARDEIALDQSSMED